MKKRRVVSVGAVLAGGFLAFGTAIQTAEATMPPQCMGWNSGYLCAVDYGVPGSALNVQGNNPNWGAFGWNDRADAFYNGGKVCGVTIYDGINYTDPAFYLVRGLSFVGWSNKARGNKWC